MIEYRKEDNTLICIIKEEIVASKISEMRNNLASHLDYDQAWEELVFDCKKVKTLDSIGVNFIVGVYKKAFSTDRKFKIIGCNDLVAKVLKLFKLDEKFTVETSNAS
ncbi:STAS domain-containing protein [bacterium]|nr:STAS domain-containing protein [bacterium]